MMKNDAGDVVRKSRFSRMWGVHSKLTLNHGLNMSVETEINNFIKTFIVDDIDGKRLQIYNHRFKHYTSFLSQVDASDHSVIIIEQVST